MRTRFSFPLVLLLGLLLLLGLSAPAPVRARQPLGEAPPDGQWDDQFTVQGMDNWVQAIAAAPDGTLYVGGDFSSAGGGVANRIARWVGASWRSLGDGVTGDYPSKIDALALASDGTLYVGGASAPQVGFRPTTLLAGMAPPGTRSAVV
ncbi:MAG: delta-60 repeat domain-containing protein [Ardenticatenaceae bacterium]